MAEITATGWYCSYFPHTGRLTGQTANLKYYIQVPDEDLVGPMPANGWPLLFVMPGSGYYHPNIADSCGISDPADQNSFYYKIPAVRILPIPYENTSAEWKHYNSSSSTGSLVNSIAQYIYGSYWIEGFKAVRELFDSIRSNSVVFYKEPDLSVSWNVSDFPYPVIDYSRVYYVGYSLGSLYAPCIIAKFRDAIAAAVCGGYVPIDNEHKKKENYLIKDITYRQLKSIAHIPILWYGGEYDSVIYDSTSEGPVFDTLSFYEDIVSDTGLNRWYFARLANATHSSTPTEWAVDTYYVFGNSVSYNGSYYICKLQHTSSSELTPENTDYWVGPFAYIIPGKNGWKVSSNKFDTSNHSLQYFSSTGISAIDWLTSQTLQTVPALDYSTEDTITSDFVYHFYGLDFNDYLTDVSSVYRFYLKNKNYLKSGFGSITLEPGIEVPVSEAWKIRLQDGKPIREYIDGSTKEIVLTIPYAGQDTVVRVIKT